MKRKFERPETQATRGAADLEKKNGPMSLPIYQTSTFEVRDNDEQLRVTGSDSYYTRYGNPTNTAAEKTLAELEGVDAELEGRDFPEMLRQRDELLIQLIAVKTTQSQIP